MAEKKTPYEKNKQYAEAYEKKAIRRYVLKINKNTDQDIIAVLESTDNVQGYLKDLIRADIAKEKNQ